MLVGDAPEAPQQCRHDGRPDGRYEEMAPQLQQIDPVAHVDVGDQQEGDGNKHQDGPTVGDAEGTFDDSHHQQPPATEQQHT